MLPELPCPALARLPTSPLLVLVVPTFVTWRMGKKGHSKARDVRHVG